MLPCDAFVYRHWWLGRVEADVHMRELGVRLVCDKEGGWAYGW